MAQQLVLTIDLEKYAASDVKIDIGSTFEADGLKGKVTQLNLKTGVAIVDLDEPLN